MDGLTQLAEYKQKIKNLFFEYTAKRTWITTATAKKVQRFQQSDGKVYKMEALLDCEPKRLFTLCADHHYTTRSAWDPHASEIGHVLEEFQTDDGRIYRLKRDVIQWIREHTITLFWSTTKCTGIWVKQVDQKSFLVIISNAPITTDPFHLEYVARDSYQYHSIYNPWKCQTCYKMVPAHELYCRNCQKERYVRCADLACYEPQLKDAKVCWKCKEPILPI